MMDDIQTTERTPEEVLQRIYDIYDEWIDDVDSTLFPQELVDYISCAPAIVDLQTRPISPLTPWWSKVWRSAVRCYKSIYGCVILAVILTAGAGPVIAGNGEPSAAFYRAIAQVETRNNDRAVGDGGRARGRYQIHAGYWRDGCRYGGVSWPYRPGVYNAARCRRVMAWYWQSHGARSNQVRARMHNGGPGGVRSPATARYWKRVKAVIGNR